MTKLDIHSIVVSGAVGGCVRLLYFVFDDFAGQTW